MVGFTKRRLGPKTKLDKNIQFREIISYDKLDVNIQFGMVLQMPMFSLTAEYALRAVVHLAAVKQRGDGASQTLGQIAHGTRVPEGYLSKVLQSLSRSGVILSQRGLGGGFRLAAPAESTTILAVLAAVDPIERIHTCPLGLESHGTNLCPLHRRLDEAMAFTEKQFANTTVAELILEKEIGSANPREPLCSFPLRP